jgi:hypothetical protein
LNLTAFCHTYGIDCGDASVRGVSMKSRILRGAAAISLALALLPSAVRADPPESHVEPLKEPEIPSRTAIVLHPFAVMAGNWSGGGTIELTNDIKESLRCRAGYNYGQGASSLALSIRCASDNYKFELTSDVTEKGGVLSGRWKESTYDVAGSISGRVAGNRVSAVAKGESFTAALSVNTSGNRQTVTITPEKTYIISVQIALNKVETATAGRTPKATPAAAKRAVR